MLESKYIDMQVSRYITCTDIYGGYMGFDGCKKKGIFNI
jgi:hypothetical protein